MVFVIVQISPEVNQEVIDPGALPRNRSGGDYTKYREIGDDWYERGESAVCWVPSVISPFEFNVLINQHHADFRSLVVSDTNPAEIDTRIV